MLTLLFKSFDWPVQGEVKKAEGLALSIDGLFLSSHSVGPGGRILCILVHVSMLDAKYVGA